MIHLNNGGGCELEHNLSMSIIYLDLKMLLKQRNPKKKMQKERPKNRVILSEMNFPIIIVVGIAFFLLFDSAVKKH